MSQIFYDILPSSFTLENNEEKKKQIIFQKIFLSQRKLPKSLFSKFGIFNNIPYIANNWVTGWKK